MLVINNMWKMVTFFLHYMVVSCISKIAESLIVDTVVSCTYKHASE